MIAPFLVCGTDSGVSTHWPRNTLQRWPGGEKWSNTVQSLPSETEPETQLGKKNTTAADYYHDEHKNSTSLTEKYISLYLYFFLVLSKLAH